MSVGARAMLTCIRLYQGVFAGRPSPCRFEPTCSHYAAEAITRHGGMRGGWLAVRRLGRCHPWGGTGADPVPDEPVRVTETAARAAGSRS